MNRSLLILPILLVAGGCSEAASAPGQARQCSLDAMTPAEKRALETGYYERERSDDKAQAEQWVVAQAVAFRRKLEAEGVCPPAGSGQEAQAPATASVVPPEAPPAAQSGDKPCKRLELENVNVPNLGGSMGFALIHVCKDK